LRSISPALWLLFPCAPLFTQATNTAPPVRRRTFKPRPATSHSYSLRGTARHNRGFNELAAYADAQLNHGTPGLEKSQRFIDRPYHHRILQVSLALAWNRLPSCTQLWHFYLATVVLLFSFWGKGLLCSFFFTVITNQS
jgi:hypothetical protein